MYARPALCRWNAQLTCPVQDHCTRRPIQKQNRYIKKQDPTPPLLFETMARLESEYQTLVTYSFLLGLQIECHQMVSFDIVWCIHDPCHGIIIIDIQIQNYRNICNNWVLQCSFSVDTLFFSSKYSNFYGIGFICGLGAYLFSWQYHSTNRLENNLIYSDIHYWQWLYMDADHLYRFATLFFCLTCCTKRLFLFLVSLMLVWV